MKCDNCKKNDANFHSITNINGKITEKHLCSECAQKDSEFENNTESFINDFMSDFKTSLSFFSPRTSLGFDEFFDDDFFNLSPLKIENAQEFEKQEKAQKEILQKRQEEKSNQKQKELEIKKLDLQLKKAVVEERYEDAIVLRDKIKALKNENLT